VYRTLSVYRYFHHEILCIYLPVQLPFCKANRNDLPVRVSQTNFNKFTSLVGTCIGIELNGYRCTEPYGARVTGTGINLMIDEIFFLALSNNTAAG
jgi:hypothetical protein